MLTKYTVFLEMPVFTQDLPWERTHFLWMLQLRSKQLLRYDNLKWLLKSQTNFLALKNCFNRTTCHRPAHANKIAWPTDNQPTLELLLSDMYRIFCSNSRYDTNLCRMDFMISVNHTTLPDTEFTWFSRATFDCTLSIPFSRSWNSNSTFNFTELSSEFRTIQISITSSCSDSSDAETVNRNSPPLSESGS